MVDVHLTADGKRYDGHDESEDMYAFIDLCLDKLDRQVRNAKATATGRRRQQFCIVDVIFFLFVYEFFCVVMEGLVFVGCGFCVVFLVELNCDGC